MNVLSKSILSLSFIMLANNVFSKDLSCPEKFSLKEKANTLLEVEFAGSRIDGMDGHDCLNQKHFPYALAIYDASNEVSRGADVIIRPESLRIQSVELIDSEASLYLAKFSVRGLGIVKEVVSKKEALFEDEFLFMMNTTPETQKAQGCASIIAAPDKIFARKECLPKE